MINMPLIENALARIDAEPENWDQRNVAETTDCATTYCLAGWILIEAGYRYNDHYFVAPNGEVLYGTAMGTAANLAGLSETQWLDLFINSIGIVYTPDDLRSLVKEVVSGGTAYTWETSRDA